MPTDNCPVLEEVEWSPTESPSPIRVAYDEENNAVIFQERETGHLVHTWTPDRPGGGAVASLFLTLSSKPWATVETLHAAAAVVHEICVKAPGQVTLPDELVSILRSNGNRWMTTAELAAEVNRRGRHWKAHGNRITGAKVLGRTKLYARTFECLAERVRLSAG
jgi:hypothetical protein